MSNLPGSLHSGFYDGSAKVVLVFGPGESWCIFDPRRGGCAMAAGLHGSARTTPRVRAELQASQEATRVLASRHGLNPKTVAKWRGRTTPADRPMGPSRPCSTVLTEAEEAIVVEFRRRTLLPLDDVLGCLRESIPKLTRSALHRCLQRHGISRLPQDEERASKRGRFAETKIG